ncbi:MAG: DUF4339 domain-containing protein [Bdellovibrionales bacterium]
MAKYYVQFGEKLFGPWTIKQLQNAAKKSAIPSTAYVCKEGSTDWFLASDIVPTSDYFNGEQFSMPVDSLPDRHWVVLVDTHGTGEFEQDGPFSTREVLTKVSMGEIDFSNRVWKPGFESWERIGDLESFIPSQLLREKSSEDKVDFHNELLDNTSREELLQSVAVLEEKPNESETLVPSESDGIDLTLRSANEKVFEIPLKEKAQKLQLEFNEAKTSPSYEVSNATTAKFLPVREKVKSLVEKAKESLPLVAGFLIAFSFLAYFGQKYISIDSSSKANATSSVNAIKSGQEKLVLRLFGQGLSSMKPRLKIMSNFPLSDKLQIQILGREGKILNNYRFEKNLTVDFKPKQENLIPLIDLGLASGLYRINASLGNLKAEKELFIGVDDIHFDRELKLFNTKRKKRNELERKIIKNVASSLTERTKDLKTELKKKKLRKEDWQTFYNTWKRKFYKTAHTELRKFNEQNKGLYVNPEEFETLKRRRLDLWKEVKEIRASKLNYKDRKSVANRISDFETEFKKLY